jgi:hypothetical protein
LLDVVETVIRGAAMPAVCKASMAKPPKLFSRGCNVQGWSNSSADGERADFLIP